MFKILIIKRLFNLSDAETEYQINDRLSFVRFLHLGLEETVPDEKTIWDYSNKLSQNGAGKKLFDIFDSQIRAKGLITQTGSIADATFI